MEEKWNNEKGCDSFKDLFLELLHWGPTNRKV